MAELTIDEIEPIARQAIRERLRNADAEHAILDISPGGPPDTLLVHVNSGGNAIAAEDALTAAGYLVESRPAGHGVVLGVALRSFDAASLRYARNMRDAGLEVIVEQVAPGQTRVSGRVSGSQVDAPTSGACAPKAWGCGYPDCRCDRKGEPHPLGCSCGCDADGFTDGSHAGSPRETETA
jgi:hypothetical protein